MIFSEGFWVKGGEQDAFVPVSATLSFSKMEAPLRNAQDMFLNPLLGEALTLELEEAYIDRTEGWLKLIRMSQSAVMNLAFWYYFDMLQMRITDQGFQRQESDNWQQPYKYQEDRLKANFKHRGFDGLDKILDYLYDNIETFGSFSQSPAYAEMKGAVVRNPSDVERLVYIGGSRLLFLRLRTEFETVEETRLVGVMGRDLYDRFRSWLVNPDGFPSEECDCSLEDLRQRCAAVVIRNAVIRLLKQTGTLTDKGLYFDILNASGQENHSRQPASDAAIGDRMALYESDAQVAEDNLRRFLSRRMSSMFEGGGPNHIIRDNDNKQAFFAM